MSKATTQMIANSFDDHIAARGYDYWQGGYVVAIADEGDGVFFATVRGSKANPYIVHLTMDEDGIDSECTCPYGEQCKHGAAVAYALVDEEEEEDFEDHEDDKEDGEFELASDPVPLPAPAHTLTLPHQLSQWLESFVLGDSDPSSVVPGTNVRVIYALEVRDVGYLGKCLVVTIQNRSLLKDGTLGQPSVFKVGSIQGESFAKHVTSFDRALLADIHRNGDSLVWKEPIYALKGRHGVRLLNDILATGRAYWGPNPLKAGREKDGIVRWRSDKQGKQNVEVVMEDDSIVIPLNPPYYVNRHTGECGRVRSELPPSQLANLLFAPALLPEQVRAVAQRLSELGLPKEAVPVPAANVEVFATDPIPCLKVELVMCKRDLYYGGGEVPIPFARLTYDYMGRQVAPSEKTEIRESKDGQVRIIQRSPHKERAAQSRMHEMAWHSAAYLYSIKVPTGRGTSYCMAPEDRSSTKYLAEFDRFLAKDMPELIQEGWRVDVAGASRYVPADQVEWEVGVDAEAGSDWFEFKLGIRIGDHALDLRTILDQIFPRPLKPDSYSRYNKRPESAKTRFILLEDGTMVGISVERAQALLQPLIDLFGDMTSWPDDLRLSRSQMIDAEGLAEAVADQGVIWRSTDELEELRQRLNSFDKLEQVDAPEGFHGTLRKYQREGLAWLQFLREYGFGGILADDMGLGKTVQVLAHILLEKQAGRLDRPVLVVAPTSTLPNWRREVQRFVPEMRLITLRGSQRHADYAELAHADIVLTSYPILARDREKLLEQKFHLMVLDEAQYVKNSTTASAKAARELDARHRLCLTGTPVENRLDELWSLFHFLMPGFLGSQAAFRKTCRNPIDRGDAEVLHRLLRRIRPFMLRRTKHQVLTELPPKTEIVEVVELGEAQRDLYEAVRVTMDQHVRELLASQGLSKSHIHVLDALLKLRQVCCDARLVKLPAAQKVQQSAKLDRLLEMLTVLLEDGRRILLFSQFTSMLDLVEEKLREAGIEWVRISGDTQDRDTPVQRFENGEVPLFLISLKAGGTGLNLVAADTVIHYDPWWNPAVEKQATDRAHRIGQTKNVTVYKLVAAGTVEEKILDLQKRKGAIADAILQTAPDSLALGQEDLVWLFEKN